MIIAVLGANGRSGKIFVEHALNHGHKVVAGVYGENDLTSHENLTIKDCDATSKIQVQELLTGVDAVVSLIGHGKKSPPRMQTNATQAILEAMSYYGLSRLISLTGTGVRMPGDKITLLDRFSVLFIRLFAKNRLLDGIEHAKLLQKSDLNWTILRVIKLQNIRPQRFSLKEHGPGKSIVSRYEVAQAILELLQNNSFIRKSPIISTYQRNELG